MSCCHLSNHFHMLTRNLSFRANSYIFVSVYIFNFQPILMAVITTVVAIVMAEDWKITPVAVTKVSLKD